MPRIRRRTLLKRIMVKPPLIGFFPVEVFNSLKRDQMMTPGTLVFLLLAFSPIVIWLAHDPNSIRDPWIAAAKTCAFLAISTLSVNYILSARLKFLEDLFGGLDRMYRVHKAMGRGSLMFMVLHPFFLILDRSINGEEVVSYLLPIGPVEVSAGIIAIYIFIILIGMTVALKISYHIWHMSHKFLGIVLVLSLFHAVTAGSDLGAFPLLRFWIIFLSIGGLLAYFYMLFFYKLFGPKFNVKVTKVHHQSMITDLYIEKPDGFQYQPGQYIFLRFPRFEGIRELFPFSLSSDPSGNDLRVSIRRSGDYTSEKVPQVNKGDKVILMGPYGKFGKSYLENKKDMVWIAGGIGITPFLSMAKHESIFPTGRNIQLIWIFKDPKDPTHDSELFREARNNAHFSYTHWVTSRKGRMDIEQLSAIIGGDNELKNRMILLCGPPPMVSSLSKQLRKKGIPYKNIVFEDFNMLD